MLVNPRSSLPDSVNSKVHPKSPSVSETRRLLSYLKPYTWQLTVATTALLLGSAIGLVFPLVIQNLVNTVLADGTSQQLNQITLALIGIFLIRAIFYYFQTYWLSYIGERIVVDLRNQVYEHLQMLSIRFYTDRRVGELISRLSSDVTVIRTALTSNIATVLSQGITFIGSLALMLWLNWQLTLFILVLAPIVIASAAYFGAKLRKLSTLVQDQLADSSAVAEEALSNVRIVKAFTREILRDRKIF